MTTKRWTLTHRNQWKTIKMTTEHLLTTLRLSQIVKRKKKTTQSAKQTQSLWQLQLRTITATSKFTSMSMNTAICTCITRLY